MPVDEIQYSEKYNDDKYEYRHVILPLDLAKNVPKSHLMTETEWRNLGVQQSPHWMHYMMHGPDAATNTFEDDLDKNDPNKLPNKNFDPGTSQILSAKSPDVLQFNIAQDSHDLSFYTQLDNNLPSLAHCRELQSSKHPQKQNHSCALCQQYTTLEYLIPNQYRKDLLAAIQAGKVSENQESEIIRQIVTNMIQHDKVKQYHVMQVAVLLVKQFPFFKGAFGSEHVGTSKRIKDCLKRQMQKKNTNVAKSKADWIQEQCQIMRREIGKEQGTNMDLIRETLRSVRTFREKDAKALSATEMLRKYAALQKPELLKWELCDSNQLKVTSLNKNWVEALPKLLKSLPSTQRLNANGQTIHLLLNLPILFKAGKQKVESLLVIHKTGSTIKETIPPREAPPFLTAIGNPEDDTLTLYCYVDGCAVFTAKAAEAIPLLPCTYWIFGIKFKPAFKQELLLLSACIFKEAATRLVGQELPKSLSVMKVLKAAGIS